MRITLNGEPFDIRGPLTVSALLEQLEVDARRVAVEHNETVVKRAAYDSTLVEEGDQVEIVNIVGGGTVVVNRWSLVDGRSCAARRRMTSN